MPINCPLRFDETMLCGECRYLFDGDKCNWFFPARPIKEILTLDERMERLEKEGVKVEHIHFHSHLSKKEWAEMEQTRWRSLYALSEINKHIDASKKKGTKYIIK